MSSTELIRPLRDVWLRPRRVFRELATQPIGITDYLLAAAQGIATSFTVYRTQMAGTQVTAAEIVGTALLFGPFAGILSMYLFAAIYRRLGARAGGKSQRDQVFHVLAYGGIPVAASLLLWAFSALLIGEAAFIETPGTQADAMVGAVLTLQSGISVFLFLWSVVLQVMGLSEIQAFATRKAFGVWLMGQLLALLAVVFLSILIATLFPGLVPNPPH